MYTAYFGLTEPPFALAPDPRYLYMSERHREGLAHLLYGTGETGGCVQLTGEVGTGKTTLCRCLLEQLPQEVDVALILNPRVSALELLAAVCDELRVEYPKATTSVKVLVDALNRYLLDAHARGRRTVLIIDEAQNLAPEVLEQVRLLTNLETTRQKLLQVILIGQPELITLLQRRDLRQLAQRITARYHLTPFTEAETRAYVRHRLQLAGQQEPILTTSAVRQIHALSRGVPRLINILCDRALLGAYARDRKRVDAAIVRQAAREVLGHARLRERVRFGLSLSAAALAGAAIVAAVVVLGPRVGWRAPTRLLSRPVVATATQVSAVPAPAAVPAAAEKKEERPKLARFLADPAIAMDRRSALAALFGRWHVPDAAAAADRGCERAREEGLRCLARTGTWTKMRRFDVPAVIELTAPGGEKRYATVVAVGEDTVWLQFGERRLPFPVSDVDLYWDGSFLLLWKTPPAGAPVIRRGARGATVAWVRERLDRLDGVADGAAPRDVYDQALANRVVAFQRGRALVADGVVGEETLAQLSTAVHDADAPSLAAPGS